MTSASPNSNDSRIGLIHAICAYSIWGFIPLFFKQLEIISPIEVVAHRVIWSLGLLLLILWQRKRLDELRSAFADRKVIAALLLSSILIAANWLIYVYSIFSDRILAASLGYYLNPVLNILIGFVFLGERLRKIQWLAAILALAGVSILALEALASIWISLSLAASFAFYGLVRKTTNIGSLPGLTCETILLFLPSLGYAIWAWNADPQPGFGYSQYTDIFMILGGVATATPLLFFASAARKLSLTTLGFIQYIGPTIQFLIGVFVYDEPFTTAYMLCFGLIWISLIIYSGESWLNGRKQPQTTPSADAQSARSGT